MSTNYYCIQLIMALDGVIYWDGTPNGFCSNINHAKKYATKQLADADIATNFPLGNQPYTAASVQYSGP